MNQTIEKIIKQLRKSSLSQEDRTALWGAVLDKLGAIPLSNTIVVSPMGVMVNGKDLGPDQVAYFNQTASALKENFARKLIAEQLKYLAISTGIHNSKSVDELMFSKACLWVVLEEEKLINSLTSE